MRRRCNHPPDHLHLPLVQKAFLQSLTLALRLHNAGFLKRLAKPSGRAKFQIEYPLDAIGKACAVTVDQSAPGTSHRRELRNQVHTAEALLINRPNAGWRCHQRAAGHSWRSAQIGSTLVARSAGIRLASTATTIRDSAAPAMLTGSAGLTW